jgi:mannosyltransferase
MAVTARAPRADAVHLRRWIVVGLTLLAFALRLYAIDAKGIWWDESLSLFRAVHDVPYILSGRIDIQGVTTIDQHPPLYFVLLHGVLRLAGESDLALRWISLLAATLIVPLLYALGSRVADHRAGVWAALWGALSPFYLWYAQEARMYTLVTMLGLAATYCLWRASQSAHVWRWLGAYALVAAASVATHYMAAPLVATHALLALALGLPGRLGIRPRWLWIGTAAVGLVAGLLALDYASHLFAEPVYGRSFVPLSGILIDALNAYTLGISVRFRQVWPWELAYLAVFLVGVAATIVAAIVAARRATGPGAPRPWAVAVLLLGQILLPIGALWVFSLRTSFYMGSRYIMVYSPSFYLGLGMGMRALHGRGRVLTTVAAIVLVAGMAYSTQRYFGHAEYAAKEDHRGAAQLVTRLERPGDAIILTAPENEYAFRHYYRGALDIIPLPYPPLAAASGAPPEGRDMHITTPQGELRLASALNREALAAELAAIASRYDRLWLVSCRPQWSDPEERVRGWLDEHLFLDLRTYLPSYGSGVTVAAYLTQPPIREAAASAAWAAVRPLTRVDGLALLESTLSYLGPEGEAVVLDGASAPRAPLPGGRVLAARLTWRVEAPLRNVKHSLRLVDAQGGVWAQQDDRPLYNEPTAGWPLGAVVQHVASVTVPIGAPPGNYTLELVLYHEDDLTPLPVAAGNGETSLRLGEVAVGRTPAALCPAPGAFTGDDAAQRVTPAARWGALRLASYSVSSTATTDEPLELTLHWQFEDEFREGVALVVHWADEGGAVRHSAVQPLPELPAGEAWRSGEPLTVRLRLVPPPEVPPGAYRLHLLVHQPEAGRYVGLRRGLPIPMQRSLRLGAVRLACAADGDARAHCH